MMPVSASHRWFEEAEELNLSASLEEVFQPLLNQMRE
jgi:hypothetical protein